MSDQNQDVASVERTSRRRRVGQDKLTGYLFVAPAVIFLFGIVVYALVETVGMSFTEYSFIERASIFVGLDNYKAVLTDSDFWMAMRVTMVFTLASVVLHLLMGGAFALLLNEHWFSTLLRDTARGILILPWLFSFAASALVWGLLLHPFGVISYLCVTLGIAQNPVEFLGSEQLALPSLILVNLWKTFPFYMIMILGGLQSIPQDLYEAAQVDGASRWRRFWHITLPLLRPVLVAITSLDLISTLGHYDLPKTLTEGGPMGATRTIAYLNWRTGFSDANFGYGAAIAVIVLILTAIITAIYLRLFIQREALYSETTTGI